MILALFCVIKCLSLPEVILRFQPLSKLLLIALSWGVLQAQEYRAGPGTLLTIPAHTRHYVGNPGAAPVFFLTVYAPPVY